MHDDLLKAVCRRYDALRLEQLVQSLQTNPQHTFSSRFEAEKQRILQSAGSPGNTDRQTDRKRRPKLGRVLLIAALLLLLLAATALAFEPVRHYVFSYFDGTNIIFHNDQTRDSLKERFTYIPQGYVLEKEECDTFSNYWVYRDKNRNKLVISSMQNGSSIFINTEDVGYEEIEIQGFRGYCVERNDGLILTWSTGKYHHIIDADLSETSCISIEELIKIANSRELV